MSASTGHVWNPPPEVRAAGETARRLVRHARSTAVAQGVQQAVFAAVDEARGILVRRLAGVPSVGAVRTASRGLPATSGDPHRNGYALDVMIAADSQRAARGDAIANWLVTHAVSLGIQYVLWSGFEWSSSGSGATWERYAARDHDDHIHVEFGPEARGWTRQQMRARIEDALGDRGSVALALLPWILSVCLALAPGVGGL